ncbi:uncharacterized protein GGS22DRAFT_176501 [Annulohypoxylon maeteangense]|uniref:uncharacterized protein n=1 Tax=Annulohypoxylon maeteangense TaxID=1927788 RepID=UPI002008752A|nr:uncharacterized protein GGS22DRAFT_176501 [Annulohypoxylon maeteangense]KAI0879902.1 hypothetical protein GGS22DRAFT_176501 [Annulohypoxylon maeteangense]
MMMMMMNGTDVASLQPDSKNARKRPRIASVPPPANYSPSSSSSPSSRITKANKSKRSSFRKRESTAADVTAAASISPTETRGGPNAFSHGFPEIKWEYTVPPDPPNYNGELTVSEPRNHFALSSTTLPQTLDSNAYSWPPNHPDLLVYSNPPYPMCHQPVSYLPAHENLPHENSSRDCLVPFSGVTTHSFGTYPLHQPFEPVDQPNLIAEDQPYLGGNTSRQGPQPFGPDSPCLSRPRNRMGDQYEDWLMVNPEQSESQQPAEDGDPYNGSAQASNYHHEQQKADTPHIYDDQAQASSLHWGDNPTLEKNSWDYIGPQIVDEIAADVRDLSSRPERRTRSHLSGEARTQTSKTRKLKACIRCRMQKIRCDADPENEDGECLKCQNVNPESKKVVHRLPCLRWKLAEVTLYRDGGLGLTKRWSGVKMKDLGPRDWETDEIRTIKIVIGCRKAPLELSVRKFRPINGDVTWKCWVDAQGTTRRINIEPYALANIWETSRQYSKYVTNYALIAVAEYVDDHDHHVDDSVRRTYNAALDCHRKLICTLQQKGDEVNHLQFLTQYFCLWFATRNMLGSAILVGDDKLDMEPVNEEGCPYNGKVCIPRMIPAQFDSLGHQVVLTTLRKLVLDGLWKMMASKNPRDFFIIYITVFMLLHEVSITSRDRFRRARDNNLDQNQPYDLEKFVERHQEAANIILSHWHYYKRDVNEMKEKKQSNEEEEKKKMEKVVWGELEYEERELLIETREAYEERAEDQNLAPLVWEDDLYFVSQMFEEGWRPRPTFVKRVDVAE